MKHYLALFPGLAEAWKLHPMRIIGKRRSRCCEEATILVQSKKGGWVTANCAECNTSHKIGEAELEELNLWVSCPRCGIRMEFDKVDKNYAFTCSDCDMYVLLADLLPSWEWDEHGTVVEMYRQLGVGVAALGGAAEPADVDAAEESGGEEEENEDDAEEDESEETEDEADVAASQSHAEELGSVPTQSERIQSLLAPVVRKTGGDFDTLPRGQRRCQTYDVEDLGLRFYPAFRTSSRPLTSELIRNPPPDLKIRFDEERLTRIETDLEEFEGRVYVIAGFVFEVGVRYRAGPRLIMPAGTFIETAREMRDRDGGLNFTFWVDQSESFERLYKPIDDGSYRRQPEFRLSALSWCLAKTRDADAYLVGEWVEEYGFLKVQAGR